MNYYEHTGIINLKQIYVKISSLEILEYQITASLTGGVTYKVYEL